jgi:hypothetical protein
MAETVAGFPFWKLVFKKDGAPEKPQAIEAFVGEATSGGLTDLFIFSHGWNNDPVTANNLYKNFFGEVRKLIDDPNVPMKREASIGVAGVIWPSILWPENKSSESEGGAASLGGGEEEVDLTGELKKVFTDPDQQQTLDELGELLDDKKRSHDALKQFKVKLSQLIKESDMSQTSQDNLEQQGILSDDDNWREVFEALADQEEDDEESEGGAVGLFDPFKKLWNGAKAALRVTTYWEMKSRAGIIGKKALGPLIGRLHEADPNLRVHLLGHSFGARLVSYSLAGLPETPEGGASPVKSLFLIQGAFSHFTFADALPFDKKRKGELAGMAGRVDGPLLTTHTLKDMAVGTAYPLASVVAGQDAADATDSLFRWGAMGHDGAQAVNAHEVELGVAGADYPFEAGKWCNLDANKVIIKGGPPIGSHSDIVHPHTAWAALAAAGIGGKNG